MYKFNRNIIASSLRYQHKLICKETNSPGCDSISFNFLSNFIRNILIMLRGFFSNEGLTLETSAFRISVRWPIYIINSVDKTKFLYTTSPPTQHHSFFRNYPLHFFAKQSSFSFSDIEIIAVSTGSSI